MKNLITIVAAATVSAGMLPTARADFSSDEARIVTVRFSDLDTSRAEGAATLFKRINGAARNVCRDLDRGRALELRHEYAECVHRALGNAVAVIDEPTVTAYAATRGFAPERVKIASAE